MYCGIIGDIIDSRKIKNRAEIQKQLEMLLETINTIYEPDIAANFIITTGDEFQGLLSNPENLIKIINYIKIQLYPIRFRFGIGFGEINTAINRNMAIGADGPAYYMARNSIDEIKINSNKYEKPYQDIKINIDLNKFNSICNIVNGCFSASSLIENKWTDKQREVIKILSESDNEFTQNQMSNTLEIEKSSVQRRLNSSDYYTYKYIQDIINKTIQEVWEDFNAN